MADAVCGGEGQDDGRIVADGFETTETEIVWVAAKHSS
jgi:hypothetical protein